ncbi:MAG: hypothetical protein U0324_17350 [Polyangiales bacterium]
MRALALSLCLMAPAAAAQTRFAVPLADATRAERDEGRVRAWVLFAEGAASTAAGATMALATGDDRVRFAGLMTLGFGAVNLALALPWALRAGRVAEARPGETELAARLRLARAAHGSAAVFALNVGLDVAYVAAGAAAWALANGDERLRGGGIAALAQGAFLLGFDVWGWVATARDAERYTALAP